MRGCAVLPTSWCSGHADGVAFIISHANAANFCLFLLQVCLSLLQLLPFVAAALPFLCWQLLPFFAATSAFPLLVPSSSPRCNFCLYLVQRMPFLAGSLCHSLLQGHKDSHAAQSGTCSSSIKYKSARSSPAFSTYATGLDECHVFNGFLSCLLASLFACRLHDASLLCRSALTHQWAAP